MGQTSIFRAKHLIPLAGQAIENGAVAVCGTRIVAVGRCPQVKRRISGAEQDLGDAVIIPGLINAHTHLELTDLHGRIKKCARFVDWLRQVGETVVKWKLHDKLFFWREGRFRRSVRNGIRQSIASGVTTVGDICNSGASLRLLRYGPLRAVVFQEVLDLRCRNPRRKVERVARRLRGLPNTPWLRRGIAPHAPYSASLETYRHCALRASDLNMPLATHVHETPEEIDLFEKGTGDLRRVMEYFLGPAPAWRFPARPICVLDGHGILTTRTVLAHCNYLNAEDIKVLQRREPSVVYCPRSHAYFGHAKHPVRRLLDLGVNVALGTDSLASCDSLNLLDEMRFLVESREDVSPEEALTMATENGARALDLGNRVGQIAPGCDADMAVVGIPDGSAPAHEAILDGNAQCILTIVRGRTFGAEWTARGGRSAGARRFFLEK